MAKRHDTIYVTVQLDYEYDMDKTDENVAKATTCAMLKANMHTIEEGVHIENMRICGINEE